MSEFPYYDQWKTDPEFVHPEDAPDILGMRMQENAAQAWDAFYERRPVTDFTNKTYKPGDTVRWLDAKEMREGKVIGAITSYSWPLDEYVILHDKDVVLVDEQVLERS